MNKLKCDVCGKKLEVDKQGEYAVCFNCNKMFKVKGYKTSTTKEVKMSDNNNLKCKNCGGKIEVDNLGEYGVCFSCNSMFKLEKKTVKKKSSKIKLKPYQFVLVALLIAGLFGINIGIKSTKKARTNSSNNKPIIENKNTSTSIDESFFTTQVIIKSIIESEDDIIVEYKGVNYSKDQLSNLYEMIKNKNLRIDISYTNKKVSKMKITETK